MGDYFNKIKSIFLGGEPPEPPEPGYGETISNQKLIDQVLIIYKKRFKQEATRHTMLFPSCFRIYLHPLDFEYRKDAFNVIARDMANEFNAFNRGKKHEYKNCIPHATDWLFQFIEFKEGTIVEGIDSIQVGDLHVVATLYSQDFSKNKENISNEGRAVMTRMPKKSVNPQYLNNANLKAFLGMDMQDRNRFKIRITEDYEDITFIPKSEDKTQMYESDVLAYLICDKNFTDDSFQYKITERFVEISGKNDSRKGTQYRYVAKVDYPLPDSIVHIKFENGRFFLAAFGKVRLNQMLVPQSKGGDLHWEVLSDNSKMLINDEVSIEFNKIQK